jgi:putative acetyltransferase
VSWAALSTHCSTSDTGSYGQRAADALDEPLVALLGSPSYYRRFGFRAGTDYTITPPDPSTQPYFQVRPLAAYTPALRGAFTYPAPFDSL